ncbi:HIRAN domain-containing protein [Cereibacter johrii]|uniref:HIRAN domain-containing protein n=1 Tax=Cereibacter johrii TaxID=445629 RepID=UPI001F48CF4D|nr:HIRAN domain-containing protein [Cereibacter johrii]MEA5162805.1 HIRAN domain-containing protein [Cereibacter johrii]
MDRRHLLLGGGALAALPLPALAAGAGLPLPAPAARMGTAAPGLRVLESYIASRDRFPAAEAPRPGERLRLRREPERAFDPLSVRVERPDGLPLGYLPAQPAQVLAALMDAGAAAEALVAESGRLHVYLRLAA